MYRFSKSTFKDIVKICYQFIKYKSLKNHEIFNVCASKSVNILKLSREIQLQTKKGHGRALRLAGGLTGAWLETGRRRQAGRQAGEQADRLTDRQTGRQADFCPCRCLAWPPHSTHRGTDKAAGAWSVNLTSAGAHYGPGTERRRK